MDLKSNFLKIMEEPLSLTAVKKELIIAKYDLLVAKSLCKKNFKTFVDVGSASGEYSQMFKKMFPRSKIYSYEPIPEFHGKFFKPSKKIALWNKNSILNFNVARDPRTSSLLNKTKETKEIKVDAMRFDSLNVDIRGPALLKVDVEGAEREVLEGFGEELKKFDVVLIELSIDKKRTPSQIFEIMQGSGFHRFVQKDLRLGATQSNIFFIKDF